jgi:hypothetical protein
MSEPVMSIPLEQHPDDLEGLFEQVLEAVRQAIEEAKKDNPIHTATGGRPETRGGNTLYTFTLEDEWEPEANSSMQVFLDPEDPERTIAGTVLSVLNGIITFATESPLPQTALTKVSLQENTVWLLERLLASLQAIQAQGEAPACMISKLFSLVPCTEGRGQPHVQIATFTPDDDQVRAVALGMASERAFIVGPPGAGKTSTECLLALEHLHAGKTVYLLAFTNVALDNAMKRLKQYCEASGQAHLIREHRLVRVGKTKDLVGEEYSNITLQGIVDQQMGTLVKERNTLQQEQSDLEELIARLSRTLVQQQEDWDAQKAKLHKRLEDVKAERQPLEQKETERLQPIRARLKGIDEQRHTQQQQRQAAKDQVRAWSRELQGDQRQRIIGKQAAYDACQQQLLSKRNTLRLFQAQPWWKRALARLDGITATVLSAAVSQAEQDVEAAREAVEWCEQNRVAYEQRVQAAEREIDRLKDEEMKQRAKLAIETPEGRRIKKLIAQIQADELAIQKGDADLAEALEEVERHTRTHARVVARLSIIEEEERSLTARVLGDARLIGATLTGLTTNPHLRTRVLDAVIVDEASMASMGMLVVAAAHAFQHVNLVGDPLQLAPIVKVKNQGAAPHALYWLGTDIFSHLGLTLADADAGTNQVVLLSQQSRMVPQIAEPDSRYIYGGRLKNRPDPERKILQVHPLPECPLLLVDTSDVDRGKRRGEPKICTTARPPHGFSKYNNYHVECVVKLVRHLAAQLSSESQAPQIGIVTPYGAQKTRLRNALRARGLLRLVHVGTVHSFQSLEYPIMIFDTVEAPDVAVGRFISDIWGRGGIASDATRLINVAHSRARDKLIYIAHLDYINERQVIANRRYRSNHVLTQFVNYADTQGHVDSCDLG